MADDTHQNAQALIRLQRLTKVYPEGERERAVLCELDAVIGRGERIVLLGRSGSGKSTLLNLIAGIDTPTSGEITVDGVALGGLSETARTLFRRRHVGFVFQFFNLIPTLTVEENLYLPLELNGMLDDAGHAHARALLREMGLEERAASFPDRLSGGEQQRVAIARALVHRPAVVLADEPTGNLDQDTGRQVLELLSAMTSGPRSTLVLASHSHEALAFADRAFRLEDGRLMPVALARRAPG